MQRSPKRNIQLVLVRGTITIHGIAKIPISPIAFTSLIAGCMGLSSCQRTGGSQDGIGGLIEITALVRAHDFSHRLHVSRVHLRKS